jgi:hypothetical protein
MIPCCYHSSTATVVDKRTKLLPKGLSYRIMRGCGRRSGPRRGDSKSSPCRRERNGNDAGYWAGGSKTWSPRASCGPRLLHPPPFRSPHRRTQSIPLAG